MFIHKKVLLPIILITVLVLTACATNSQSDESNSSKEKNNSAPLYPGKPYSIEELNDTNSVASTKLKKIVDEYNANDSSFAFAYSKKSMAINLTPIGETSKLISEIWLNPSAIPAWESKTMIVRQFSRSIGKLVNGVSVNILNPDSSGRVIYSVLNGEITLDIANKLQTSATYVPKIKYIDFQKPFIIDDIEYTINKIDHRNAGGDSIELIVAIQVRNLSKSKSHFSLEEFKIFQKDNAEAITPSAQNEKVISLQPDESDDIVGYWHTHNHGVMQIQIIDPAENCIYAIDCEELTKG